MKYFTPELYLRFASANRREVVAAHEDGERAIESYKRHLEKIGPQMTANSRRLAETLCLHDADYLGMAIVPTPETGKPCALLLLRQDLLRIFLLYYLAEQPLVETVDREWPYSKQQVHWLYDEFDVAEDGTPRHEILLSNGQIMTLRFHELELMQHTIEEPALV